ncbi:MAG: thioredoxin-dependent thiol peroxidase [Flexilinea sp.]
MLETGIKAPDFTLTDKSGKLISLSDYKGKKVVVYFYPKDDTPGCIKEACAFRNVYDGFRTANVEVIGISKDSVESHVKFAEKYNLPFILLADPDLAAIKAYDVWHEKQQFGNTYMGVVRTTYVVDEAGMIIKVFPEAKPDTNAQEILDFLAKR